jgi:hypothetical protein
MILEIKFLFLGSMALATCMVMVEAPEVLFPCNKFRNAALPMARTFTPGCR